MPETPARIQVRLVNLLQLFNSMDPSPFLERDIDADAEEFIISWARELPKSRDLELVIHLQEAPKHDRTESVEKAVRHYFQERAALKYLEFRKLMRQGRTSLMIGLLFLTACLLASEIAGKIEFSTAAGILKEGLTIAGWVAMWRPLEIYLYDWWPLRDEWRLLERLALIKTTLVIPS